VYARSARLRSTIGTLTATVALIGLPAAGQPAPASTPAHVDRPATHIDPADLDRGADPRVAYLVRDTIHDGDRRIRVWPRARHVGLWETDPGYVVWDDLGRRMRVSAVDRDGEKRRLGRSQHLLYPTVSASGRRVALVNRHFPESVEPTVVRVANPHTGRVIARRELGLEANVAAVTDRKILVTVPGRRDAPTLTWWWNYRRDTMRRISRWRAIDADVRADRVLFARTASGTTHCRRVAPLSHPRRTLWRECRLMTHHWNRTGTRALASLPPWQWDYPGTDRWVVVKGRSGEHTGRVVGQLNWGAAWESNKRFLSIAQNDQDRVAVIRCRFDGRCVRASRLWQAPVDQDGDVVPPVTLPEDR
jgi:hypothetical protein